MFSKILIVTLTRKQLYIAHTSYDLRVALLVSREQKLASQLKPGAKDSSVVNLENSK